MEVETNLKTDVKREEALASQDSAPTKPTTVGTQNNESFASKFYKHFKKKNCNGL